MVETWQRLTADQRNAFVAAFLGWGMDAFDYFLLVLVIGDIARDPTFHASLTQLAFLTTATLMMWPLGAFLFGLWADRHGRRVPLIVNVLFYSICGVLCALAPGYVALLVLRLLYGIGMGGEWGLGTALAMEKLPPENRGFFSGVLQEGYNVGYLMASVAYLVIVSVLGLSWRWIFLVSMLPALVSLLLRYRVQESEVWEVSRARMRETRTSLLDVAKRKNVVKRFIYLIVLMSAFNWMSHGTQDIYPSFLQGDQYGGAALASGVTAAIVVVYNLGAIIGGIGFGAASEHLGRRRTIMICAAAAIPLLPIFVVGDRPTWLLAVGPFLMLLVVQGAWGVIPAHLTELSPGELRGIYLGVPYQLGNLIAALCLPLQAALAVRYGYTTAMVWTILPVLAAVFVITWCGPEAKGRVLGRQKGESAENRHGLPVRYRLTT